MSSTLRLSILPAVLLAAAAALYGQAAPRAASAGPPSAAVQQTPATAVPASPAPAPSGEITPWVTHVQNMLGSLARFDQDGRSPAQKVGFEFPEKAVNEYLAYTLKRNRRPGISSAIVTLVSAREVAAAVEVDFDAVRGWSADIIPEPLRATLRGKQMIRFTAQFESHDGTLTFTVKSAAGPDGKPLPEKFARDLAEAIEARQPEPYQPGKPLPLPFGLKRVWISGKTLCGES